MEDLEFYLGFHEEFPGSGPSLEVEGVLGLMLVAKEALKTHAEMYLTECTRCCSNGASYRLFSAIPTFDRDLVLPYRAGISGLHPDTFQNKNLMIARCYNQESGLAERISKIISKDARRLGFDDGVPSGSIIYRLGKDVK